MKKKAIVVAVLVGITLASCGSGAQLPGEWNDPVYRPSDGAVAYAYQLVA